MEGNDNWIFYLKLQRELPREYFLIDQQFKQSAKSLVPVGIKGLTEMVKKSRRVHVLIVIKNLDEYKYFTKNVKKVMKFLVRTGRVNLYIASSFNGVNDTAIMRRDYYHYMKLPVSYKYLCGHVSTTVDMKEQNSFKWPGGVRSQFKLTG